MRLVKLIDGVWMKFAGFALMISANNKYMWTPRFAKDGSIYMWVRSEA